MPLISFVVPAYRVQGYLRECLDSILDQPFSDLEVIGVDDCSPDHSGAIFAEYAERDARVRVVSLPENVGLGRARNAGLERATGQYVWFVDSDDWLAEGCLTHVADRLRETRPDVLVVDHVRAHWNLNQTRSAMAEAFPQPPGAEVFSARERPEVLDLLHTAWNKLVRRDFLVDLGLPFLPGWYEDVSYTYPVLVAAERISVLDRVCYLYRQRRTGAITSTRGERHFEIFPHWRRVFALVDEWSAEGGERGHRVEELRPPLFRRMIWHYLSVLGHRKRVPGNLREKFFAEMVADYRRHLPASGYPVPDGLEGLKQRLVASGRWRTFSLLRAGAQARTAVRRKLRRAKRVGVRQVRAAARLAYDALLLAWYHVQLRLPMDEKLAVYAAYWYRGYACNPAAIHEKARESAPEVRGVWVVRRDRAAAMPAGVPYVVAGTPGYYRALARAKWLVNNVNFPDRVVKRRGSVHLQTHHGTPVKVMGLDQQAYPTGSPKMEFGKLLRRFDRWDYSVTSNAFSTQMWERAYPATYETLEVGYPRNDRLATATAQEVMAARARLGLRPDEWTVLYAPTHREHMPGYRPPFDPDVFASALGPTGRLLVRSHYFNEGKRTVTGARVLDVSDHPSVEDVYLASDVLITDYSSAMFDYGTLDRPIVIYAPDWEAYRLTRGVYFDVTVEAPGVVVRTFADLVDAFRAGAVDNDAATKARSHFRRRFCALDDGGAAERVVRRVFRGESA